MQILKYFPCVLHCIWLHKTVLKASPESIVSKPFTTLTVCVTKRVTKSRNRSVAETGHKASLHTDEIN